MRDHIAFLYGANLGFTRMLVGDILPEQMTRQPHGVINHPAWSLGHLAFTAGSLGRLLGRESTLPPGWSDKFSAGPPTSDSTAYPSKEELLDVLVAEHERNERAFRAADASLLASPHPDEQTRAGFPTMGDLIIFLMTVHEGDHLGQVAAWRRAMGLGSFLS